MEEKLKKTKNKGQLKSLRRMSRDQRITLAMGGEVKGQRDTKIVLGEKVHSETMKMWCKIYRKVNYENTYGQ